MRKKTIQCSVGKSAKKHGWYANEGDKGSVGVVPFWVRGSNVFGVGQIFFGMHQFFFWHSSKCFKRRSKFFRVSLISFR